MANVYSQKWIHLPVLKEKSCRAMAQQGPFLSTCLEIRHNQPSASPGLRLSREEFSIRFSLGKFPPPRATKKARGY